MDRSEWVLVPKEPTEAMLDVFHDRVRILCNPADQSASIRNDREVWSAMLAAAPHPPAEQASGEHVEALREFAEDYRRYIPQFHAQNRKRMKRNLADLDAAIAALSQRPVVDDEHVIVRLSLLYGITGSFGRARARHVAALETLLDALAPQQPEKGETP